MPPTRTEASGPDAAADWQDELPLIGQRYRLIGMLGGGGMGNVYLAYDAELDEEVAVKLLKPSLSERNDQIEMLRREVKFARRVTHPNVLRTFDIGEHDGSKFITMELVEGRSLADLLPRKMHLAEVVRIAEAVCAGLGAAHDAGVLHRDLKPSNVLLADDGRVLLSDFGIARLADAPDAGAFAGTPGYMAPELLANEPVDARADIWALGILLYEIIAGERPFPTSREHILQPLLEEAPDPRGKRPEIPLALARVVTRCLARRPSARFGHPREVIAAIAAALPTPARAESSSWALWSDRRARVLAVLPLVNRGRPEDEHVAEGLTALLVTGLDSQRLRVPSRGAVEAASAPGRDPLAVGRDLGAEAIVTGSVERSPEEGVVKIELQMIGTGDGLVLFRKQIERQGPDLVSAAEEASRAIASALLVERKQGRPGLHDAEAIDLYFKGVQEFRRRWERAVFRAAELLRQALERAPDDPMILSAYALAVGRRLSFGGSDADLEEARAVGARALRLAPDRPEPYIARASIAMHLGDNVEAARAVVDALQLAPHHVDAHHLRGLLALEVLGPEAALAHLYTATTIDPTLTHARWWCGRAHALLGEWARSDAIFAGASYDDQGANDYWVNRTRAVLYGRTPEREASFLAELAAAPDFDMKRAIVAVMALVRGEPAPTQALAMLADPNRSLSRRRAAYLAAVKAELAAAMGNTDGVVRAIAEADAALSIDIVWLDRCPALEPARARPEVSEIRARFVERAAPVREVLTSSG